MGEQSDFPLDGPQVTNAEVFRIYIELYLENRTDIHKETVDPAGARSGPLRPWPADRVYAFTKTTAWEDYEGIQAEIFNHLIAAANFFDLRLFQQPTGFDMANAVIRR